MEPGNRTFQGLFSFRTLKITFFLSCKSCEFHLLILESSVFDHSIKIKELVSIRLIASWKSWIRIRIR